MNALDGARMMARSGAVAARACRDSLKNNGLGGIVLLTLFCCYLFLSCRLKLPEVCIIRHVEHEISVI
jgi:hypothetical protein